MSVSGRQTQGGTPSHSRAVASSVKLVIKQRVAAVPHAPLPLNNSAHALLARLTVSVPFQHLKLETPIIDNNGITGRIALVVDAEAADCGRVSSPLVLMCEPEFEMLLCLGRDRTKQNEKSGSLEIYPDGA